MKVLRCFLVFSILFNLFIISSSAHPGRTDGNGGHYVRTEGWGYPIGSYHYHHGLDDHDHPNGICPYDTTSYTYNTNVENKDNDSNTLKYVFGGVVAIFLFRRISKKTKKAEKHKPQFSKTLVNNANEGSETIKITNDIQSKPNDSNKTPSQPNHNNTIHLCPRCGSKMLLRNGRYGKFYGCSRYPYCKGTKNIKK